MIKVLNIISDSNIGGAGKVLLNFMEKTDRSTFDHTVIVPEKAQLTPKLKSLDLTVVEMAHIGEKSLSLKAIGAFKQEFERFCPNLIHTHASLSARIAARQWGKCAIIHTRHSAYPQGRIKTSFPVKNVLGFINNRYSDVIIAVSPATCENLTDTGTNPNKIITMLNGVQPLKRLSDAERNAGRSSLGIAKGDFVCSIIARLVPEKGHSYVIQAAQMLRDLPVRFIIAGSGPGEQELRDYASALGLDSCIFTGFVDDVTLINNISDLQLNASYGTEASSLSLLEGFSLGNPAVVSDFGGNPYHIDEGKNGNIVPKCDANALAKAIRKLYEEPETLARMSKAAEDSYKNRFTAEIMTANIEDVYHKTLAQYYPTDSQR